MRPCEARTVKRRLETYRDLLQMAEEKDREALMLQVKYEDLATPGCIRYDREEGGSGSGRPKESIYHEIFSEQQADEKRAARYRKEAEQIERFVAMIENQTGREIITDAFIKGKRYRTIGRERKYEISSVHSVIVRCLENVPLSVAEECGLL